MPTIPPTDEPLSGLVDALNRHETALHAIDRVTALYRLIDEYHRLLARGVEIPPTLEARIDALLTCDDRHHGSPSIDDQPTPVPPKREGTKREARIKLTHDLRKADPNITRKEIAKIVGVSSMRSVDAYLKEKAPVQ